MISDDPVCHLADLYASADLSQPSAALDKKILHAAHQPRKRLSPHLLGALAAAVALAGYFAWKSEASAPPKAPPGYNVGRTAEYLLREPLFEQSQLDPGAYLLNEPR